MLTSKYIDSELKVNNQGVFSPFRIEQQLCHVVSLQ